MTNISKQLQKKPLNSSSIFEAIDLKIAKPDNISIIGANQPPSESKTGKATTEAEQAPPSPKL